MAALASRKNVTGLKHLFSVCYYSNRASVSKIRREKYAKMYPTLLVFPNGSTITVRYHEPRMIIKLPPDIDAMSEEEKKKQLQKQKPKDNIVVDEDIEDNFDANKYINLWKSK